MTEDPVAPRPDAEAPAEDPAVSPAEDPARRLEALLAEHRDPDRDVEAEDAGSFDPFAPIPSSAKDAADAAAAQDEDALPDAPLFALLRNVQTGVGVERIDRIWVFPPRRLREGETAVVVVGAFTDLDSQRRRVYAAHYTAHEDADEPRLALDEFGTAPADRVGRMVEEVLDRIEDGPADAPRPYSIEGREDRWNAVLHEIAEAHLAALQKDPRLRR